MSLNHFDIQKPIKINIAIPGYDPIKAVKQFKERMQKHWNKAKLDAKNAHIAAKKPIHPDPTPEQEVAALNESLVQPVEETKAVAPLPNFFVESTQSQVKR